MNRKEFLNSLGIGAAFALSATCLGACSKSENDYSPASNVDFTLDLTDSENAALATNGGYVVRNTIVVARANDGRLVAATQQCSHEGIYAVVLRDDEWYCPAHGARFSLDGDGINGTGSRGLKIYNTAVEGDMLRVYA